MRANERHGNRGVWKTWKPGNIGFPSEIDDFLKNGISDHLLDSRLPPAIVVGASAISRLPPKATEAHVNFHLAAILGHSEVDDLNFVVCPGTLLCRSESQPTMPAPNDVRRA